MGRFSASLREEEERLLEELTRLADWIKTNPKKPSQIHLKRNQFGIFRRLCGRIKQHAICDMNVQKVDPEKNTYDGIPIVLIG